jgi:hypothetical protein
VRRKDFNYTAFGCEPRRPIGLGEPFGYPGVRRERGELDAAEVDDTLRGAGGLLRGEAGMAVSAMVGSRGMQRGRLP